MAESVSSKSSGAAGGRPLSTVGGPVTIGTTVFVCVKRCPLRLKCNADERPLQFGPNGVDVFPFLPWGRGSSENPVGRVGR
eukprot:8560728-Pyramimonas_sp.AAC.1